ncbi:MAG: DNA internalization-related competence protein ComEC/Rec2 [bacterium]|nr:DNA internalization-related competence protein ComEC/Rec2 [bacterium]
MKILLKRLRTILQYDCLYYFLLIINIIYIIIYVYNYELKSKYNINENKFILTISDIKIDGDKLALNFYEDLVGTYYFKNKKEKEEFNYEIGDKLEIEGSLKIPSNNTIFNTFNYKKYLERKGIKYILNINTILLKSKNRNILIKLKNLIYKRISNIKNNDYLYALILGRTNYIDNELYNNYKINGVTHLFSLSGLHVSMLSSIIIFILNKLRMHKKISLFLTSILLIIFSFIASFTPSILRATIFFILININEIYYLNIKSKNILYLTFIIITFINPNYIFNIGFILSFTITFFIILFNENYKIKGKIKSILIISLISFLSSIPLIINMSYEINILCFFNNLFFIPYVSYIVFPLALLNIIFPFLNDILTILITFMENMSEISTNIFNLYLYFARMNILEIIIYYTLFILIIKNKKIIILPFIVFVVYLYIKTGFNNNTYIYFIDVNQGDSTLIITKNKKSILIDTGGKIDFYKEKWALQNNKFNLMTSSMIPFFKSIGLKKIDYLLLTHGDYDHMGEAINLVNNFKVDKVIFNCGTYNELEQELINVLDKKKIPYYSCIKELNIDDNKLYFLNNNDYGNENDNSSVIYTELNNHKFLFMGDAGVGVEQDLIEKYNLQDIDVLKVGHHGSKTSSSELFIDEINPKYSIISVGKNNRYGHPNDSVLDNLENSKIYRTDKDGSIMFKINNNKLQTETCPP